MKRIIALILCLALISSMLTACDFGNKGDNKDDSSSAATTSTVKIKSDLKNGKIPELPLTLGTDVNEARNMLNALENLPEDANPEEGYTYYSTKTSGDTVRLSCEGNLYYYNESKASKGISAMVTFSNAYGFSIGIDMLSDITAAVRQKGTVYSPTADDLYFLFGEPDVSKYQAVYYTEGDYRVDFILYDSYLSAVVIWDTENWDSTDA